MQPDHCNADCNSYVPQPVAVNETMESILMTYIHQNEWLVTFMKLINGALASKTTQDTGRTSGEVGQVWGDLKPAGGSYRKKIFGSGSSRVSYKLLSWQRADFLSTISWFLKYQSYQSRWESVAIPRIDVVSLLENVETAIGSCAIVNSSQMHSCVCSSLVDDEAEFLRNIAHPPRARR